MTSQLKSLTSQDAHPLAYDSKDAMFWDPSYLHPSPAVKCIPLIFWLVQELKPKLVINFGGGAGVAHIATCEALSKLKIKGACYQHLTRPNTGEFVQLCSSIYSGLSRQLSGELSSNEKHIALLTVHLDTQEQAQAQDWAMWLKRLDRKGAAVVYGAAAFSAELDEILFEGGFTHFRIGDDGHPILLVFGKQPEGALLSLSRHAPQDPVKDWFVHSLVERGNSLAQSMQTLRTVDNPIDLPCEYPISLEEANNKIAQLIREHGQDLDSVFQVLQRIEEELSEEKLQMRNERSQHEVEMEESRQRERRLRDRFDRLEAEVNSLRNENSFLHKDLQDFRQSTFWRATSPLRKVVMFLRH
ncbi:hypothetical protein [Donghicola mangrovi]|uniref:Uncharacterized protein n=1 Tax=Donghicola mangrovi TaxID=2729614 RepID=A0A850QBG3_9RHOB|nr:hypothetical protein [Donghicola mangrovi]NVO25692.1 hypothetical protein [Donghicola mangrovi]